MRLDAYLAEYWPDHSRATWQKYCLLGYVQVNGEVVTSVNKRLGEDDSVTVHVPERIQYTEMTLPVIYEDDNVIVINKPSGVLSHAKGAVLEEFTVAEFVRPKTSYGSDGNRPGIVHRLDRDTSGVMITAKNEATASYLGRQFSDRKVKKTYVAVLEGIPKLPAAKIDLPIGRNPKTPSTFRVDTNGKPAETTYEVIAESETTALALLKPRTGRTHQLRVHMAYLGTPIRGDRVYGKPADRLFLHARDLEITLPGGERKTFSAPVPKEFTDPFDL